jgi:AraC-like DNA-binding protein
VNPIFEKTPQGEGESFHCEVVRGDSYNAAWHFHPELQITLVLQGHGYRLVGDKIAPLKPGDLVLVGPNLPHVWHQDKPRKRSDPGVHAIVLRFGEAFAGREFLELPEMVAVRNLFQRAARGLVVTGRTRLEAARRMEKMPHLAGLARLSELLALLDVLAHSREFKPIASAGYVPNLSTEDQERMERIISYINAHLGEPIGRAQVARTAYLSPGAFSRVFKLRTGKTLPEYVNELRVGRACRLLADGRSKVIDIALECGFSNLANFNRRFRQITRVPPRDYRRLLRQSMAPAHAL